MRIHCPLVAITLSFARLSFTRLDVSDTLIDEASSKASLNFHHVYPPVMQEAHPHPAMALPQDLEEVGCMSFYGQPPRAVDHRLLSSTTSSPSFSLGDTLCAPECCHDSNCQPPSGYNLKFPLTNENPLYGDGHRWYEEQEASGTLCKGCRCEYPLPSGAYSWRCQMCGIFNNPSRERYYLFLLAPLSPFAWSWAVALQYNLGGYVL